MDIINDFKKLWNNEISSIEFQLDLIDWKDGLHFIEEVEKVFDLLTKYHMLTGKKYKIKSMEDSII